MNEILQHLPSLGIAGLLFVMWWCERQERAKAASGVQEALKYTAQIADVNKHLLDVIRENTQALSALREELHMHRGSELEWLQRMSQQLEEM